MEISVILISGISEKFLMKMERGCGISVLFLTDAADGELGQLSWYRN
jgi:hypothetical protein